MDDVTVSEEDCRGYAGEPVLMGLQEQPRRYKSVTELYIWKELWQLVEDVKSPFGLPQTETQLLLLHFDWNAYEASLEWFSNGDRVAPRVGLRIGGACFSDGAEDAERNGDELEQCGICLAEGLSRRNTRATLCGHRFCVSCWKYYITDGIRSMGLGCLRLRCPHPGCETLVGEPLIISLAEETDQEQYWKHLLDSYVATRSDTKWCPAAGCSLAVAMEKDMSQDEVDAEGKKGVTCDCGHSFCWTCLEEPHMPLDCQSAKRWLSKISDDFRTLHWMMTNTKSCPECKRLIEKEDDESCVHMICAYPCWHEFCWLCLEDWNGRHYHTYEELMAHPQKIEEGADPEDVLSILSKEGSNIEGKLARCNGFFDSGLQNEAYRAAAIEKALAASSPEGLNELPAIEDVGPSLSEHLLLVVANAWKQIAHCHKVLRWTYGYGYYKLPRQPAHGAALFHTWQDLAEDVLMNLYRCMEIFQKQEVAAKKGGGKTNSAGGEASEEGSAESSEGKKRTPERGEGSKDGGEQSSKRKKKTKKSGQGTKAGGEQSSEGDEDTSCRETVDITAALNELSAQRNRELAASQKLWAQRISELSRMTYLAKTHFDSLVAALEGALEGLDEDAALQEEADMEIDENHSAVPPPLDGPGPEGASCGPSDQTEDCNRDLRELRHKETEDCNRDLRELRHKETEDCNRDLKGAVHNEPEDWKQDLAARHKETEACRRGLAEMKLEKMEEVNGQSAEMRHNGAEGSSEALAEMKLNEAWGGAVGGDDSDSSYELLDDAWTCAHCTFSNPASAIENCEMCGLPKGEYLLEWNF